MIKARHLLAGRFPVPAGNNMGKEIEQVKVEQIAEVCHEAQRAYYKVIVGRCPPPWEEDDEWQRASTIAAVRFHLENPNVGPNYAHDKWLKEKQATGWRYGSVESAEKKEHPCCVPYDALPAKYKAIMELFFGVVCALRHLID